MERSALYYPYIHVRDLNWVKGTLLLFDNIHRMIPPDLQPEDKSDIREYADQGLILRTDMESERVEKAQINLRKKILSCVEQDESFRIRFGFQEAMKEIARTGNDTQIHVGKFNGDLLQILREADLAWEPTAEFYEPFSYSASYVQVHPRIGQAVMATIAVACAQGQGLDIVADESSGRLHRCLIEQDAEFIYDTWLHPDSLMPPPPAATAPELFEIFVKLECDLSNLGPKQLIEAKQDRKALNNFVATLEKEVQSLRRMDPGPRREKQFVDAVGDLYVKWQNDYRNSHFFKRLLKGLPSLSLKSLEKIAEKVVAGGMVGGGAAVAGGMAVLGGAAGGAAVGFTFGLVSHAAEAVVAQAKDRENSPYRYLSILEQNGVSFRSAPPPDVRPVAGSPGRYY